jgi:hypothetical protein
MPNKGQLHLVLSKHAGDIRHVRLPGLQKPFEQLTISELVQLRPGGSADDAGNSIGVNGVSSDITISVSTLLNQIGEAAAEDAMLTTLAEQQIRFAEAGLPAPAVRVGTAADVAKVAQPVVAPTVKP